MPTKMETPKRVEHSSEKSDDISGPSSSNMVGTEESKTLERPLAPLWVADYILANSPIEVSNSHLNHLIYLAQAWWLAWKDEPLISEPIRADDDGPVVLSVYYAFIEFGENPIDILHLCQTKIRSSNSEQQEKFKERKDELKKLFKHDEKIIIDGIIDANQNERKLSHILKQKNSPWEKTYDKKFMVTIDNSIIKKHYKKM